MKKAIKLMLALGCLWLCSCASTTFYQPVTVTGANGTQTVKAVKTMSTQGDIILPLRVGPDGIEFAQTGSPVGIRRVALVDSKGNPRLDGEGRPIYDEYPIVAGIYHSSATESAYQGGSFLTRSVGSLAGTIAASVAGVAAAQGAASAATGALP